MDPETNELKELVRQSIALSQENNKMLHAMRRSSRWSFILRILWWLTIFGVSSAVYYYYLAPYVMQLLNLYQSAQHAIEQAQQVGSQFGK